MEFVKREKGDMNILIESLKAKNSICVTIDNCDDIILNDRQNFQRDLEKIISEVEYIKFIILTNQRDKVDNI